MAGKMFQRLSWRDSPLRYRVRRLGCLRWIRCVIDVADVEARGAEDAYVSDALGGGGVPERSALPIGLNKMHATGPERGVLGGLALGPYEGVVRGIDPDP